MARRAKTPKSPKTPNKSRASKSSSTSPKSSSKSSSSNPRTPSESFHMSLRRSRASQQSTQPSLGGPQSSPAAADAAKQTSNATPSQSTSSPAVITPLSSNGHQSAQSSPAAADIAPSQPIPAAADVMKQTSNLTPSQSASSPAVITPPAAADVTPSQSISSPAVITPPSSQEMVDGGKSVMVSVESPPESPLSSAPSDLVTPSPLKRKRADDDEAIRGSASPKLGPRLSAISPAKRRLLSLDNATPVAIHAHRTRSGGLRGTSAPVTKAAGPEDSRATTPASFASFSPRKGGRGGGGAGAGRGGGGAGRGGRPAGNGRSGGKGKKDPGRDPGWPNVHRLMPETEESIALKKRQLELKQFFNSVAAVHATAMANLASRDLTKVVKKKNYHTTVPEHEEIQEDLENALAELKATLQHEYEFKVKLANDHLAQQKELLGQQFHNQAEHIHSEHLAFAQSDLGKFEEFLAASDDADHTDSESPILAAIDKPITNQIQPTYHPAMLHKSKKHTFLRGYNSKSIPTELPSGNYDLLARREIMAKEVIDPVLDAEHKKAGIEEENLRRLSAAAQRRSQQELQEQQRYAVGLSRLADVATVQPKVPTKKAGGRGSLLGLVSSSPLARLAPAPTMARGNGGSAAVSPLQFRMVEPGMKVAKKGRK